MTAKIPIRAQNTIKTENITQPTLRWNKLSSAAIGHYTSTLSDAVDRMATIRDDLAGNVCVDSAHCQSETCRYFIQQEYDDLISCIQEADSVLPRHKPGACKDWWSPELSDLKCQSIDIQSLWIAEGRPRSGPTCTERLRVRSLYKCALRSAQRQPKLDAWNDLHSAMECDDTNSFWNSWRVIYNNKSDQFAPVVDGCSSKSAIATAFSKSFQSNCEPNNKKDVDDLDKHFSERYVEFNANHESSCNCSQYEVSVELLLDIVCSLKNGKCADEDGIHAEHFKYAPYNFLSRLTKLINSMLAHSFVPKQFRFGYIIPIIKDRQGDKGDVSNYCGITISPMLTKLFEHVLKRTFSDCLNTSSLQFGFKRRHSTAHAIHCLKETVNYYINNGNSVYCSFLDASKAFDRLVHSGLFLKMVEKKSSQDFH